MSRGTVVIDALPESARRYVATHAVVAVDVIRATTTAVTAVALGRRCFPVPSLTAARRVRAELGDALLVGELGGETPRGFDLGNSPAAVAARTDVHRPIVLLSSSGTQLVHAARSASAVYLACLRNAAAVGRHLAAHHPRVAVIGAGSRGEFRTEDQIGCAWVAAVLVDAGYAVADTVTRDLIARWRSAPASAAATGRSADYLRRTGQLADLEFVVTHANDVDVVCALEDGEVVAVSPTAAASGNGTALRA